VNNTTHLQFAGFEFGCVEADHLERIGHERAQCYQHFYHIAPIFKNEVVGVGKWSNYMSKQSFRSVP
jgi:hypothetical protein